MKIRRVIAVFVLLGCHSAAKKPYYLGGERIEGNLTPGAIFNGKIRFYDSITSKLTAVGYYKNGRKNGKYEQFFVTGGLKTSSNFVDDVKNGKERVYDEFGRILREDSYYYGLRAGSQIQFDYGQLKYYSFNNLENRNLFSLDYDSLKGRRLTDILKNSFFYSFVEFHSEGDSLYNKREYFIYTPNPPRINFRYSLVKVDRKWKIVSVIARFDQSMIWSKFEYDSSWNEPDKLVALRLQISDSINHDNFSEFKLLH